MSILLGKQNFANIAVSDYFDLALITVYLFLSFLGWIKDSKIRKRMIRKYYYLPGYLSENKNKIEKVLDGILKKTDGSKFHAIFSIMYILHFLSSIENDH